MLVSHARPSPTEQPSRDLNGHKLSRYRRASIGRAYCARERFARLFRPWRKHEPIRDFPLLDPASLSLISTAMYPETRVHFLLSGLFQPRDYFGIYAGVDGKALEPPDRDARGQPWR